MQLIQHNTMSLPQNLMQVYRKKKLINFIEKGKRFLCLKHTGTLTRVAKCQAAGCSQELLSSASLVVATSFEVVLSLLQAGHAGQLLKKWGETSGMLRNHKHFSECNSALAYITPGWVKVFVIPSCPPRSALLPMGHLLNLCKLQSATV